MALFASLSKFCGMFSNRSLFNFMSADGDILVNIFTPEQRQTYNLEKLWRRGEVVDVSDWLIGPRDDPNDKVVESSLDDWIGEEII